MHDEQIVLDVKDLVGDKVVGVDEVVVDMVWRMEEDIVVNSVEDWL